MRLTGLLKRLLASRRATCINKKRRDARWSRLDDLEFRVIPATDDRVYDQDVRPALLAQLLELKKSG